jgi:hypothetical protein
MSSATSALKLIPTPQKARFIDHNHKTYSRDRVYTISIMEEETAPLLFAARFLKKELEETCGLHFNIQWRRMPQAPEDIIIYSDSALHKKQLPLALDLGVFQQENAAAQGYVLLNAPGHPIYVCAQSDQGAQYGIATLIQLFAAGDTTT